MRKQEAMQPFLFMPFPNLFTERLVLRQLHISNEKQILALRSNDSVNKYIDRPKQTTVEEARAFINKINAGIEKNESIYWAITLKEEGDLIGTICYWKFSKDHSVAELGYELLPHFQGKGIMQEVLSKVIAFGFENMKLQAIEAYTHQDNERSTRLLEKNNFKRTTVAENLNKSSEVVFVLINKEIYL